jgi:hypothetical protein
MRIRTETGTAYFALNNAPAAKEDRVLIRNIPADGYKDRPAEAGISVRTIESEEGMVISKLACLASCLLSSTSWDRRQPGWRTMRVIYYFSVG